MQCPVCGKMTRISDRECEACGEVLTPWRNLTHFGNALRERGLALAERGDHLGACLAFLEAALTNPLDQESLIDTARALVHLGRPDEALRMLAPYNGASSPPAAVALREEIERRHAADAAVDEAIVATLVEDNEATTEAPAPIPASEPEATE